MTASRWVGFVSVALVAASCTERRSTLEQHFPDAAAQLGRVSSEGALQLDDGSASRRGFTLPRSARAPLRINLPGLEVEVFERELQGEALQERHLVSYARRDGRSYWAALPDGLEEWVEHFDATAAAVALWDVRGAALTQLGDDVMLEDARGLGRVRVSAPVAWAADGTKGRAWLRVEGNTLALYTDLRGHVLVDPLWSPTSPVSANIVLATVTPLTNGKLLLYGGDETGGGAATASPRLYDPLTGTWTNLTASGPGRLSHTATLLRNGRVLLAGGFELGGAAVAIAELFDPVTNTFTSTGTLVTARHGHTATLLADGRVLLAGGFDSGPSFASAERYDPVTGLFTATGSLSQARGGHRAVRLQDGTVLAISGRAPQTSSTPLPSSERYNPSTGTWTSANTLVAGRTDFSATVLHGGQVLVAGGSSASVVATCERYNPTTNTWSATGSLATARRMHTATLLPNGQVIAAGGAGTTGTNLQSVESYDPAAGTWSAAGSMQSLRAFASAGLLPNGKVLVVGGVSSGMLLATAEQFDLGFNQSSLTATGSLASARRDGAALTLHDGRVLAMGGVNAGGTVLQTCEFYSPGTGTWAPAASMSTPRRSFGATLLANGKVLVAGGHDGSGPLASAELFDPATGTWSATGSLLVTRERLSLSTFATGQALAVGGLSGTAMRDSTELYSPRTGTWAMASTVAGR